jgi:cellulose synthase/poly-beta-1,6-N-acetylglucosamine synthase-like glycosyltransferase
MYFIGFIITAVLLAVYCILILVYRYWFRKLPVFELPQNIQPSNRFSVIIPARNEEDIIHSCLSSVLQQNYPSALFEIIVINDNTEAIIHGIQQEHPNLHLINLADHLHGELNSYKKKAIEIAIAQSKGDWVVTTDADCFAAPDWLRSIDAIIQQQQPVFVAAPVMFTNNGRFLSMFQLLDFISLQGITAASVSAGYHTMCNGANIAYKKEAFYKVDGFKNIDQLASGDDMLLMHKIKQVYPKGIAYLFSKDAIITTPPMPDWKSFLNQRIRWASKADKYQDRSIFWVLFLVYATNLGLLLLLLASPFVDKGFQHWLILVVVKSLVELSFMVPVARFYNQEQALGWFIPLQPFHITYTVIAGWLGKFGSYRWKGRKVH